VRQRFELDIYSLSNSALRLRVNGYLGLHCKFSTPFILTIDMS